MVRRIWLCGLLAAAVLAQDPDEEIRQARQTLEEFLKIGDELVRQGKHEAALETYREAARTYDEAIRRIEAAILDPALDPPADLAHLQGTPAGLRREIDELVAAMMAPQAGSDALHARERLRAIGKPAFPRILGAMARARDSLTDVTDADPAKARPIVSALARADECLRAMDGHLDAEGKPALRPGASRRHVRDVLRLHYRRWVETLRHAAEMPGPHRPAAVPARAPGASRWDPPATLGHVAGTPADQRREIDALVDVLFDPQAGRKSLEAQRKLAAVGKPAFPVILGRMARVRDSLTDEDTIEERLAESSLKLADECLRRIDSYLDDKGKAVLRPGTDAKYVRYILRLHYRRWTETLSEEAD